MWNNNVVKILRLLREGKDPKSKASMPAILLVCHAEVIETFIAYLTSKSSGPIVLTRSDLQFKVLPTASVTLVHMPVRENEKGRLVQFGYDEHTSGPGRSTPRYHA